MRLELKYGSNGERVIQTIKRRMSKPGRRLYAHCKDLKPVLGGMGISIISTSKGVISDREARREKVGGEILCESRLIPEFAKGPRTNNVGQSK